MTTEGEHAETAEATYTISVAAQLAGMHAQTLRQYDRVGLVIPLRTKGHGRRYTAADIERLRLVQHLTQNEGVNLAGVQRILELEDEVRQLRESLTEVHEHAQHLISSTPGVFTADSAGSVQFRPDSPSQAGSEAAGAVSIPVAPVAPTPTEPPATVRLARRRHAPLAQRGLVGWTLLADLSLQQRLASKTATPRR